MNEMRKKYYPTILQAIHLLILYMFIQTVVDFPLALIDYYKDTEYLYNPAKKILLGIGSTVFILIYGIKKSKLPVLKVFPLKIFNPLVLIPIVTFFWGIQNLLNYVNAWVEKMIPAPVWFWELFSKIFDSDFGWWGAFFKVAVVAPIVEELIFRGLILQGLRRNYNAFVAVFMSALLFSLYHLNPWQMPATFILGLLLGAIMIRTNNILLSILGHSINNLLVLLSITYWEQISSYGIYLLEKEQFMYLSGLVVMFSLVLIFLLTMKWKQGNRE